MRLKTPRFQDFRCGRGSQARDSLKEHNHIDCKRTHRNPATSPERAGGLQAVPRLPTCECEIHARGRSAPRDRAARLLQPLYRIVSADRRRSHASTETRPPRQNGRGAFRRCHDCRSECEIHARGRSAPRDRAAISDVVQSSTIGRPYKGSQWLLNLQTIVIPIRLHRKCAEIGISHLGSPFKISQTAGDFGRGGKSSNLGIYRVRRSARHPNYTAQCASYRYVLSKSREYSGRCQRHARVS